MSAQFVSHPHTGGRPFWDGRLLAKASKIGSPAATARSADKLLDLVAGNSYFMSFDPNIRLIIKPDVEVWRWQVDAFRRHAHLIKASQEDLEACYGKAVDIDAVARNWLGEKTKLVVLTCGERGAILFTDGHRVEMSAFPATLIDTVGAGDTYQAALLCWLKEAGLDHPEALAQVSRGQLEDMARFAGRAAAVTCARRGPDLPRRDELDR